MASLPGPGGFENDSIGAFGCPAAAALCFLRFHSHAPTISNASKIAPRATPIPIPAFAPVDSPLESLLLEGDVVVALAAAPAPVVAVDTVDVVGAADVVVVALFQTCRSDDQVRKPERATPSWPSGVDALKTPNWKVSELLGATPTSLGIVKLS